MNSSIAERRLLITGGAGFIGFHSARLFSQAGWRVTVLDNLSRRGTQSNAELLQSSHHCKLLKCDIRNAADVAAAVREAAPDAILHLAGQVAVTTSVVNPREDFEINALGTLNVLEATRSLCPHVPFLFSSTNKVYGKMESVGVIERNGRYEYESLMEGIPETFPLSFHSPYGCSKGAADQYVLDYHRVFGPQTIVFRQSCIYGTHQYGIEDQGWVAWFSIAAALGKKITIYGDGKQIRDVLDVRDLVQAYMLAIERHHEVAGEAFNVGGGPVNTLSLLELLDYIQTARGIKIPLSYDDWRPGDQRVFVCNIEKAKRLLGWQPQVHVRDGVLHLIDWVNANPQLFQWLK
jgi:CDP-paratose 2-epimerase